jgi:pimeloyl-ACP methyl ester carboxylesterase
VSHVSTQNLARDGVSIAYAVSAASKPLQPPVVFLHGLASNRTRWNEFIRETTLNETRDLIAVDLRGHGESMTRGAFSLERWSDDLAAILDQVASERGSILRQAQDERGLLRAIFVGHSLGAQAALQFALTHTERVAGLVLIDPIFREAVLPAKRSFVRNGPFYALAAKAIRALNQIGVHRGELPPLDLHALDLKAREALASSDPKAVEKFVEQYSSAKADLKHIPHANYLQDMVEMFRALPSLAPIACPVLALRSTVAGYQDDTIVERRLREMKLVEIAAIDCHHWPLTERPVEVRATIERWIAEKITE